MEHFIYAAGLFDGEGTVTLSKSSSNRHRVPTVSIASTSYELIKFLQETFGGAVCKHKPYKAHHSQSWSWRLVYHKAIEFLRNILPYMKEEKKRSRALLLVNEYQKLTKRNGKYSEKQLLARLDLEHRFFYGAAES